MNNINCIILSGGKSSRMGKDKALLKIGAKTIIEIMIDKLKPFCSEIMISADETEKYSQFGFKVVPDKYKNSGPLAGIYSSLLESIKERNFVISCDLPLVTQKIIERLINYNSSKEIILPVTNGKYHQLCGVYSRSVLEKAESILNAEEEKGRAEEEKRRKGEEEKRRKKRNTSIKRLLEVSKVELVDVTSLSGENEFLNMNTVEDYQMISKILTGSDEV